MEHSGDSQNCRCPLGTLLQRLEDDEVCDMNCRFESFVSKSMEVYTLRVQVPNNHILTQNLYYNHYYPKPKYQIIGYLNPKP